MRTTARKLKIKSNCLFCYANRNRKIKQLKSNRHNIKNQKPKPQKTNAKGGVAAWPDVQKSGTTLGNLTPADRHGSVQVRFYHLSQLTFVVFFW